MNEDDGIQNNFVNKPNDTYDVENTDLLKHILFSLVNVTSDKTSEDYAWSVIKNILKELKQTYKFLGSVQIGDLENLKNTIDDIIILSDVNHIDPVELGRAIQNLIDIFKTRMGNKAGYFFIQEFKADLGDEYHSRIKKIGVDLRLTDLQNEISCFSSKGYKIRDDRKSNIAFIEKD